MLYKPKEVAQKLGISTDLLRKWVDEFNVQTELTEKNHRRYTKENVELLITIQRMIQEQNKTWAQVRAWRNGDEEEFVTHEEKSRLENKIDKLTDMYERQLEFNQYLVQRLDQQDTFIQTKLEERLKIETHDRELLSSLRQTMEETKDKKEIAEEKEGFFFRLFGGKKNRKTGE
jgi:DNA-binding transcriptional MerR regulator